MERGAAEEKCPEPLIGTPSTPSTTKIKQRAEAISTTNPIDQTLLVMIWNGVTGMTSKCSTVPRSRSRMRAAPVSRTESMVIWSISATIAPNERRLRLGL